MGWCHCRGRPKPWRVNFYSIKKKGFRQPTLAAIFSSSPLRNLTLSAWIDTKNVTNPSFALYRLNLRGRRNGNANFFSQLMENISFVVKIFLNLIPLQFEREGDKYREYRVWAPLLWNLVLIHLFNLIPDSQVKYRMLRALYFNPLLWNSVAFEFHSNSIQRSSIEY